jgi:hypothetical protein
MAKLQRQVNTTSQILEVFAQNSASTTGAGLGGLTYSSITGYYKRNTATTSVQITMATIATLGTYASGGFLVVDGTNMVGIYEFDPPNAAFASGADEVVFMLTASGMAPIVIEVELTATSNQDAVHGGMSALPNTACTTNASLLTAGTGTSQINTDGAGNASTNLVNIAGSAVATGTAQLGVNIVKWSGTAVGAYYGPFKTGVAAGFTISMVESSDHETPYTGGSVTAVVAVNGGSEGAVAGTVTQVGSTNRYYFAGTSADFTGASLEFTFSASGADSVTVSVNTTP